MNMCYITVRHKDLQFMRMAFDDPDVVYEVRATFLGMYAVMLSYDGPLEACDREAIDVFIHRIIKR